MNGSFCLCGFQACKFTKLEDCKCSAGNGNCVHVDPVSGKRVCRKGDGKCSPPPFRSTKEGLPPSPTIEYTPCKQDPIQNCECTQGAGPCHYSPSDGSFTACKPLDAVTGKCPARTAPCKYTAPKKCACQTGQGTCVKDVTKTTNLKCSCRTGSGSCQCNKVRDPDYPKAGTCVFLSCTAKQADGTCKSNFPGQVKPCTEDGGAVTERTCQTQVNGKNCPVGWKFCAAPPAPACGCTEGTGPCQKTTGAKVACTELSSGKCPAGYEPCTYTRLRKCTCTEGTGLGMSQSCQYSKTCAKRKSDNTCNTPFTKCEGACLGAEPGVLLRARLARAYCIVVIDSRILFSCLSFCM